MTKMAPVLKEAVRKYKLLICKRKFKIFLQKIFLSPFKYLHKYVLPYIVRILSETFYPTFPKYKEKRICDNIQFTTRAEVVL
jgi:hypothetical protein